MDWRHVEALHCGMARATTGGCDPVGGQRRSCRWLLPALLVLAAFVPLPARAASDADAWRAARLLHDAQSTAIGAVLEDLADGVSSGEVGALRRVVGAAVAAFDTLEVHECFRVWWSYVRTSYVLYDLALAGVEADDIGRVQAATASSVYLAAMAAATPVDCLDEEQGWSATAPLAPGGGHPFVIDPSTSATGT